MIIDKYEHILDQMLEIEPEPDYILNPEGAEPFCKRCICKMMIIECEAYSVCLSCGITSPILIFLQDYKDKTYGELTGYLYKRITHLRKHWRQFQTKIGLKRVDDLTDRIELMFRSIESPFRKYKPKDRKNFFNYKYLLLKFFEIIGRNDLCKHIEYLKSKEKLKQHDEIWEKICKEYGWKFIKSIRHRAHKRLYKKRNRKKNKKK